MEAACRIRTHFGLKWIQLIFAHVGTEFTWWALREYISWRLEALVCALNQVVRRRSCVVRCGRLLLHWLLSICRWRSKRTRTRSCMEIGFIVTFTQIERQTHIGSTEKCLSKFDASSFRERESPFWASFEIATRKWLDPPLQKSCNCLKTRRWQRYLYLSSQRLSAKQPTLR